MAPVTVRTALRLGKRGGVMPVPGVMAQNIYSREGEKIIGPTPVGNHTLLHARENANDTHVTRDTLPRPLYIAGLTVTTSARLDQ
jgi:hypothetical protein